MKHSLQFFLVSALLLCGMSVRAQNPLAPANGFSVFVKGDLYLKTTNVSKAVACGGNFKVGGNIGSAGAGTYAVGNTTASLVVGGSLDWSGDNTQISNGYAQIGNCTGSAVWYADPNSGSGEMRINQGGYYYSCCPWVLFSNHSAAYFGGSGSPVSATNNPVCATPAIDFSAAFSQLEANATGMAANTNNVTMYFNGVPLSNPGSQSGWGVWNQVDITLATGVNFLNLTMADLNALQKFNFTNAVDANHRLVINVDGAGSQTWSVQTLQGANVDPAYLIYNFYNTTSLAINGGQNIKGTLFAPKADINKTAYNDIQGQVVAKSLINFGNNISGVDFGGTVPGGGGAPANTVAQFSINNNAQCLSGNAFSFSNTSTGAGTLAYNWTFGDGTTATVAAPTKTYASAGTYTVKLVVTGTGGKDSVSKSVTVTAAPTAGFTINNASQNLSGNSFTFTSNAPTSGNTYSWKFRDNGATGSSATVTRSFSGVGVYDVTQIVTAGNGCRDSATQRITVKTGSGSPTAPAWGFNVFVQNNANLISPHTEGGVALGGNLTIGGNYATAQNSQGAFRANGVPVGLLVGGRINPSGSNVLQVLNGTIAKIGDSTGFQVWYRNNNNTYSPIQVAPTGNYNGTPRLDFAVSANTFTPELSPTENPIFQSNLIDFGAAFAQLKSYSTNIATNPNTVTLYTDATLTSSYAGNVVPANSQVYISLATGVNVLNLTGANLNNFQSITFQGGAPSATKILLVNVDAPGTFNWKVTNSAGTGPTDGQYVLYNFPTTTKLNIVGSSAVLGTVFAPFADIDKTVNQGNIDGQIIGQSYKHNGGEDHPQYFTSPLPNMNSQATVAAFNIPNNTQCLVGNAFSFTNASTGAAPLTYKWTFGDGTTATVAAPTKTYASAGTYTVKLVVTGSGGAKDSISKTVTVVAQPAAGFTVNSATQTLAGNSFNFTPAAPVSGNTYLWTLGDGTTSTAASISGKNYTAVGTYTVKLVVTNANGCKDSTTQSVSVTPTPASAGFTVNNPVQCLAGNSFQFTSTATGAAPLTYKWTFGDGTTATTASPAKTYTAAGTYTVKLVVTDNNGSKDSATRDVTVYPQPAAGFTINNSSQPLVGNSFDFTTTASASGNTYLWRLGDGTTATTASVTGKSYAAFGAYNVVQVVTNVNGCKDSAAHTVIVLPTSTTASYTINDPTQCVTGNLFQFTSTTTGSGPITLSWEFGDGTTASNVSTAQHSYAAPGNYTVTLSANGPGGSQSVSMQVTVYPAATAGFTVAPSTSQSLTGNSFSFSTSSPQSTYSYAWNLGDGATATTANVSHSYTAAGPYTVRQIVSNANGCADTAYQTVVVLSDSVGSGNGGGLESEGLGGLVTRRNYNRLKLDLNKTFDAQMAPVFYPAAKAALSKGAAAVQELADMMPANLAAGDVPRISTPADLPALTIAKEALSVDYTRNNITKASVLGIKTFDRAYNHTKSICDRFKGGTILSIEPTTVNGIAFSRYAIRQANGLVEYAIAFAAGKKTGDAAYRLQTGWVISRYAKDDTVYNFQVWAAAPADANKLAGDILNKLGAVRPLSVVRSTDNLPAAYITRGVRHKDTLLLTLRNTTSLGAGQISFEERTNEVAGQQTRILPITYQANGDAVVAVPIGDGYEYEGLLYLGDSLVDQVYLADGNWGLDYDKQYTSIQTYDPTNNPARVYQDEELPVYRSVALKATSNDYITLYKALLPGTEPLDLTGYHTLKFRASGSGKVEIRLTRDSITAWKAQYKTAVELVEEGKDYEISFDDFVSDKLGTPFNPKDVKTLDFTLSANGKTQRLGITVENVSFSKKKAISLHALQSKALTVSPNPTKGPFHIDFVSDANRTLELSVADISGRVLYSRSVPATVGDNTIMVDMQKELPAGAILMVSLRSDAVSYEAVKVTIR